MVIEWWVFERDKRTVPLQQWESLATFDSENDAAFVTSIVLLIAFCIGVGLGCRIGLGNIFVGFWYCAILTGVLLSFSVKFCRAK